MTTLTTGTLATQAMLYVDVLGNDCNCRFSDIGFIVSFCSIDLRLRCLGRGPTLKVCQLDVLINTVTACKTTYSL